MSLANNQRFNIDHAKKRQKFPNFKDIFLRGLAPDGGLFIPKQIKKYNETDIKKLSVLSYVDLATEIIFNFCSSSLEKNNVKICNYNEHEV